MSSGVHNPPWRTRVTNNTTRSPRVLARYAVGRIARMAKLLARRARDVIDEDELTSCGSEAAARCLPHFDAAVVPFRPYLDQRLRWAMLHEVRRRRRRRMDPKRGAPAIVAERYRDKVPNRVWHGTIDRDMPSISYMENRPAPNRVGRWYPVANLAQAAIARDDSAEERVARNATAKLVRAGVANLKPRLRMVVARHYFEGHSFADIARDLGVTRSAVCRWHKLALETLSKRLRPLHPACE